MCARKSEDHLFDYDRWRMTDWTVMRVYRSENVSSSQILIECPQFRIPLIAHLRMSWSKIQFFQLIDSSVFKAWEKDHDTTTHTQTLLFFGRSDRRPNLCDNAGHVKNWHGTMSSWSQTQKTKSVKVSTWKQKKSNLCRCPRTFPMSSLSRFILWKTM